MYKKIFSILFSIFSTFCFAAISVESKLSFDCNEQNPTLSIELKNVGDELVDSIEIIPLLSIGNSESISLGVLRTDQSINKQYQLSLAQREKIVAESSCCAYPFLFSYKDRFGNKYSSCLLASCINKHPQAEATEDIGLMVSSACVADDSLTSSMAISVMYDYEHATKFGATELRVSYFLPEGISPASTNKQQIISCKLDANGLTEINELLQIEIENMSGDIPYAVIAQLFDSNGKPITLPQWTSELIHVNSALNYNAFPQLLDWRIAAFVGVITIGILILKLAKPSTIKPIPERILLWIEWLIVLFVTLYIAKMLQIPLAFQGNTCMGGDLPAHHYLVSHIRETGFPVSWADGWWCGFPMFHYYFPLPYSILALASSVFPHNIVFNVGVCLGLLFLPLVVYMSARIVQMPRPLPVMAVCFVVPLVFDNSHNMWGVNAYSTLAGMVANSWSFCLFLLALANICKDIQDNKFRIRTPILIAAVALSHFFTSIVLALVVGVVWLCVLAYSIRNKTTHYLIPLVEGIIGVLLVSWWLIPLAMTGEWAVAFGSQWEINFFKQLPNIVSFFFLPILIFAFFIGIYKKDKINIKLLAWISIFLMLLIVALILFFFGRSIGEVFVNCRLWPFIVFSLLFIMAAFMAYAFKAAPLCGMLLSLVLCFSFAWNDKPDEKNEVWSYLNLVSSWARYNFSGYENSASAAAAQELIDYLRSVEPNGRIAYDLHPFNESLGSTRFFEALPALTGHPIIEGGIVNSAIGSLSAYVVQGEMSEHTAGAPLLVQPQSFDPEKGLAHMELLGVRRFIAHSNSTINALRESPMWTEEFVVGGGKWIIFKHKKESNGLVRKWNYPIKFYISDNFQKDSLEWMYVGAAVREPFGFVQSNIIQSTLTYPYSRLNELKSDTTPVGDWISDLSDDIPSNTVKNGSRYEIHFKAKELNSPYIVAMSYFPNWKVKGADGPYFVTPGFMVVFPTQEDVVVYYGFNTSNWIGYALAFLGVLALIIGWRRVAIISSLGNKK